MEVVDQPQAGTTQEDKDEDEEGRVARSRCGTREATVAMTIHPLSLLYVGYVLV